MRYLLDTHVFIWMMSSPDKLSSKVIELIEDGNNLLFLSAISGLEIAIKSSIGKLTLPEKPYEYIKKQMA
jgi:PIN domain nuclease of toxin-antitoxin system